eukprot:362322-Chlamydomonas_euryale.AAC.21
MQGVLAGTGCAGAPLAGARALVACQRQRRWRLAQRLPLGRHATRHAGVTKAHRVPASNADAIDVVASMSAHTTLAQTCGSAASAKRASMDGAVFVRMPAQQMTTRRAATLHVATAHSATRCMATLRTSSPWAATACMAAPHTAMPRMVSLRMPSPWAATPCMVRLCMSAPQAAYNAW